jgi:hypothetical protein
MATRPTSARRPGTSAGVRITSNPAQTAQPERKRPVDEGFDSDIFQEYLSVGKLVSCSYPEPLNRAYGSRIMQCM